MDALHHHVSVSVVGMWNNKLQYVDFNMKNWIFMRQQKLINHLVDTRTFFQQNSERENELTALIQI